MVHRVEQEDDGDLRILPLPAMDELYCEKGLKEEDVHLSSQGLVSHLISSSQNFLLDAEISSSSSEFGFFLDTDDALENGYQLKIKANTMAWDMWPRKVNTGPYQWQIDGDRPFLVETLRYLKPSNTYKLRIVRAGEAVVVYANDEVALSIRFYGKEGKKMGFYSIGGETVIKRCEMKLQKQ